MVAKTLIFFKKRIKRLIRFQQGFDWKEVGMKWKNQVERKSKEAEDEGEKKIKYWDQFSFLPGQILRQDLKVI